MDEKSHIETIEYRLTQIETTIRELKELITETKLQDRDIKDLQHTTEDLRTRVRALEQNGAKRWQTISDLILKMLITAIISVALVKIGL